MTDGLFYYKLVSKYPEDVTKDCKLSVTEIDHNFYTLKEMDIKTAEFDRSTKTLVLTRVGGEKLIVPLSSVTYSFEASKESSPSGDTLTIKYDGEDGEKEIVFDGVVTRDNIKDIINDEVLYVITDATLKGNGTVSAPLGLRGVEQTGSYAPVKSVLDLTEGEKLPEIGAYGERYVTLEEVDDYGKLYNGKGLDRIADILESEKKGWRIPTKADWDALLNSIEPCEKNHDSEDCHVELGEFAGKYLKSSCGWIGQDECQCGMGTPPPCSGGSSESCDNVNDGDPYSPQEKPQSCGGVDKYGFTVLPSGDGKIDSRGRAKFDEFKGMSFFWTDSFVHGDKGQDKYVKVFDYEKCGVVQEAYCPDDYLSVRLVKDYDGSNYVDSEYIGGQVYKTLLFPDSKQIWLATNFAQTEGFVTYDGPESCFNDEEVEVLDVNGGEDVSTRKIYFINEWNGEYWEKKPLNEGDTFTVTRPCKEEDRTIEVCWGDEEEGTEQCIDVVIPGSSDPNIEYRVFVGDDCTQYLKNTDDLVTDRVLNVIIPTIEEYREEIFERLEELDTKIDDVYSGLSDAIDAEIERAEAAESALTTAINDEIARATSAETEIAEGLAEEIERAISAETEIAEALEAEIERATSAETEIAEALADEVERAISAETKIAEDLAEETERSIKKDEELEALILIGGDYTFTPLEENVIPSIGGENDVNVTFDFNFGTI